MTHVQKSVCLSPCSAVLDEPVAEGAKGAEVKGCATGRAPVHLCRVPPLTGKAVAVFERSTSTAMMQQPRTRESAILAATLHASAVASARQVAPWSVNLKHDPRSMITRH